MKLFAKKADVCKSLGLLKGSKIKNKADIDFEIVPQNDSKPLFSYKKNINKEVKVITIVLVVVGLIVGFLVIKSMMKKKKSKKILAAKTNTGNDDILLSIQGDN